MVEVKGAGRKPRYELSAEMTHFVGWLVKIKGYNLTSARRYGYWIDSRHLPESERPSCPARPQRVDGLLEEFRASRKTSQPPAPTSLDSGTEAILTDIGVGVGVGRLERWEYLHAENLRAIKKQLVEMQKTNELQAQALNNLVNTLGGLNAMVGNSLPANYRLMKKLAGELGVDSE